MPLFQQSKRRQTHARAMDRGGASRAACRLYGVAEGVRVQGSGDGRGALEFDAVGALVAAGDARGRVTVTDFDLALAASSAGAGAETSAVVAEAETGRPVSALAWLPWNQNCLAACSSRAGRVLVYDLTRTGRPLATLGCPAGARGVSGVACAADGRSLVYGGGQDGLVLVWDVRHPRRPCVRVSAGAGGAGLAALACVLPAPDGVMYGVRRECSVDVWDVRFSPKPLRTVAARPAAEVASRFPAARVAATARAAGAAVDPARPERVAVQLDTGEAVCVDAAVGRVTHFFRQAAEGAAAAAAAAADGRVQGGLARRPAFLASAAGASVLALGAATDVRALLLDVGPGRGRDVSGLASSRAAAVAYESYRTYGEFATAAALHRRDGPASLLVPAVLSACETGRGAVGAVAAHPNLHYFVCSTEAGAAVLCPGGGADAAAAREREEAEAARARAEAAAEAEAAAAANAAAAAAAWDTIVAVSPVWSKRQ